MSRAKLFQIAGPANHRLHPDHHPTYHHPPTPHSVRTNPHPSIVVTRDYLPSPAYSSHPNHPQQPSTTMSRVISNNEQQVWPQIQFLSLLNSGDDDSITEYKWLGGQGFSFIPSSNSLVSFSRPLRSSLSWHGALQGPSACLMHCFRNYRDTWTLSGVPW